VSCSVHDMVELERKGIATVTLCTEGFLNAGAMKAAVSGMPDLRIVGIPFPFASLPPEGARARGEQALEAIVAALTGSDVS
jgi:hypothetical protein